eukprot:scaffold35514_cov146-Isochrysis_galbana.AAC.1
MSGVARPGPGYCRPEGRMLDTPTPSRPLPAKHGACGPPSLSTAHAHPLPKLRRARPWRRGSRGWNTAASADAHRLASRASHTQLTEGGTEHRQVRNTGGTHCNINRHPVWHQSAGALKRRGCGQLARVPVAPGLHPEAGSADVPHAGITLLVSRSARALQQQHGPPDAQYALPRSQKKHTFYYVAYAKPGTLVPCSACSIVHDS